MLLKTKKLSLQIKEQQSKNKETLKIGKMAKKYKKIKNNKACMKRGINKLIQKNGDKLRKIKKTRIKGKKM